jgi:hypothetical protein
MSWWGRSSIAVAALIMAAGRQTQTADAQSIARTHTKAAGVPVMVLTVDLNNPNIRVTGMVAEGGRGKSEPFQRMIRRSHPTAAFTGTFFCTRSLVPVGDIVVDGQMVNKGGVGTGFCITADNQCEFIKPPRRYTLMDWSRFDFVCSAGPRLVTNGKASVHPGAEGFRDRGLIHSATRLAVGMTAHNKLLFVATRKKVQLGQMAKAMRKLGCVEAINLDAGSSLGMYHQSKTLIKPGRRLTNLILVYDDRERYERFKHRLLPPGFEPAPKGEPALLPTIAPQTEDVTLQTQIPEPTEVP